MRHVIKVVKGEINLTVDEVEKYLIQKNENIFQFGEVLVKITPQNNRVKIDLVDSKMLLYLVAVHFEFQGFNKDLREWITIDCPIKIVDLLLAKKSMGKFRSLKAVSLTPLVTKSGEIKSTCGYDHETEIFYHFNEKWPACESDFSKESALKALELLIRPISQFPFASNADRSVYLAAILTSYTKLFVTNKPLFGISANAAGSGKSMLSDMIGIQLGLENLPAMNWGKTEEESEKRLTSKMLLGDSVILIDNIERTLTSETLCSYLTQSHITVRILGKSQVANLPTTSLILANGNNLTIMGDLNRRTLISSLKVHCERPEQRVFDFSPKEFCIENRVQLVNSALIILSSYIRNGSPKQNIVPMGSFEDWSNVVRSSLVWLGVADPNIVVEQTRSKDPETQTLKLVLSLWYEIFNESEIFVNEIRSIFIETDRHNARSVLVDLLLSIANGNDFLRSIGRYLARNEDRLVDDLKIVRGQEKSGSYKWKVIKSKSIKQV